MPTTVFSDDCTRANSATIGTASGPPTPSGPWLDPHGVAAISSNRIVLTDAPRGGNYFASPVLAPVTFSRGKAVARITLSQGSSQYRFAILARADDAGPYYVGYLANDYLGIGTGADVSVGASSGAELAFVPHDAIPDGTYDWEFALEPNATSGTDLTARLLTTGGTLVTSPGGTPMTATVAGHAGGPQGSGKWGLLPNFFNTPVSAFTLTDTAAAAPLVAPTLSRSPGVSTIALSATANTSGTAPLSHQWSRRFDGETPVNLGTVGTSQADTPPDGRVYLYTLTTTDSAATPATVSATIAASTRPRNLYLVCLGDSITYGADGGASSFPGLMVARLNAIDERSWNYNGSPAAVRSVVRQEGHSGWSTQTWLDDFSGGLTGIEWFIAEWKDQIALNDPAADVIVSIMLGANDLGVGRSAAAYKANLRAIIDAIAAEQSQGGDPWRVMLNCHVYSTLAGRPTASPAYFAAIDELVAENPGVVLPGDVDHHLYDLLGSHWPEWYLAGPDQVHPGDPGWAAMASYYAECLDRAVLHPADDGPAVTLSPGRYLVSRSPR